jgi:hypothetical protein
MTKKTILECKIGAILIGFVRNNTQHIDGRSRRIMIEEAWRRRSEFNRVSRECANPKLFKKLMFEG